MFLEASIIFKIPKVMLTILKEKCMDLVKCTLPYKELVKFNYSYL